jgi:hypothetical protein
VQLFFVVVPSEVVVNANAVPPAEPAALVKNDPFSVMVISAATPATTVSARTPRRRRRNQRMARVEFQTRRTCRRNERAAGEVSTARRTDSNTHPTR